MKFRNFGLVFLLFVMLYNVNSCQTLRPQQVQKQSVGTLILFSSDRDNRNAIYTMPTDGKSVTELDFNQLPAGLTIDQPTWSNNLKKYFFSGFINKQSDLFSINQNGSDLKNLSNTPGIFEGNPVLSPDNKYIAYLSVEYGPQIALMETNGSNRKLLTEFAGENGNLQWSPDSQRIYFTSNRYGTPNIFFINVDGTGLTNVSKGNGLDASYSLSPNGEKLVFDSDRDGAMDIFVVDSSGGTATNITKNPARDAEPLWSPDGNNIAFRSDRDGTWDVFVMKSDGTSPKNLTKKFNLNPTTVVWMPDSENLLVTAQVNNQSEIFLLPIDGSDPINLTNNPANDYGAVPIQIK